MNITVKENKPMRMYCALCEGELFAAGGIPGKDIQYWACPEHGVRVVLKPVVFFPRVRKGLFGWFQDFMGHMDLSYRFCFGRKL